MQNRTFRTIRAVVLSIASLTAGIAALPSAYAESTAKIEQVIATEINVNQATAEELAKALNGVGLKKAEAIVAYRTANGDFTSIDDLKNVKGIGESTLNKNRARISL